MTPPAEVHETHIGTVFLVGDRAYKMKKPVRTAFLDFSTPALRLAACRREIELNRRLAPDVYLGTSDLMPGSGDVGPVEHFVVMRRMPAQRCLAALIGAGEPVGDALRALARQLAVFHAAADRGPAVAADGTAAALRRRWVANLAELAPFAGTVLDAAVLHAIEVAALRFVDGRGPLLADRLARSRIVDGHGDLVAADVFCLDDGPRALDCLEFDDHLRHVDGLDDVAFLAMDLEHLGRADLATQFLDDYVEFSGDDAPTALRHHFIAYRAVVRAKVACLRHAQGDAGAAETAVAYAGLALRHLQCGAVRLALVGGLPGTGKTTLGGALADRFGAVLISSDRLRKEVAGIDPDTPATAAYGEGLYAPERIDATYAELLDRAALLLGRGESVVLDASWTAQRHRDAAVELAHRTHSDLARLHCRATAETAGRRIAMRGHTASDATTPIALAMAEVAQAWPEAVTVPTRGTITESVELASAVWRAAPAAARR
ncbi:AAA family ATPase [Pseudonocardia sp. GCM10023141]|uniref:bifunctional aminoglycoside phosphotransferase/ATP-binding protein n=1 Tax=Pseudonocardia sp. GCM10023141 TaxID=3252653 RepID=UPI00360E48E1